MAADQWMLIGRVAAPFGVRGEVKVDLQTDFPERFKRLRRVYLGDERREVCVERARMHGGQVLLRLEGIDTPEGVRALGRSELYVPRSEARQLPEGHFYLEDAIGLEVRTTQGELLGQVTDVIVTGSNEVFVVRGNGREVLIPVIKDAVETLDISGRSLTVQPWVLDAG
jgi:16S rRNA processing protein RimM